MKSGVVGIMSGEAGLLNSDTESKSIDGRTLKSSVEVLRTQENAIGSLDIQVGRAAIQELSTEETVEIDDNGITVRDTSAVDTKYTEFVYVPNEFVSVSSGAGVFFFDLISKQFPAANVERAEFRINEFIQSATEIVPWQVGFYGHIGDAEKGTIYGEHVLNDSEIGDPIYECAKNQLGAILDYDGDEVKFMMTESGYVEVYQPSNYSEREFADFVVNKLLPYSAD